MTNVLRRSHKLGVYGFLAAVCFIAGLILGRYEPVAVGGPFLILVLVGLVGTRESEVRTALRISQEQILEQEELTAELVVEADATVPCAEVSLCLPSGVTVEYVLPEQETGGLLWGCRIVVVRLPQGKERVIPLRIRGERWGIHELGPATVICRDYLGLVGREHISGKLAAVRIYPRPERLRAAIVPLEAQPFVGSRVSRRRGEGIEFADIRPYMPGDRLRRVNWHATTVKNSLFVNEQHPENNSDIVIFLDTFSEAGSDKESILTYAVRATAALARYYLTVRDRVGLVAFGGILRWLTPAAGEAQWYRIVEALLETESVLSFAWKDIEIVPRRALTPQALVIAISPLLDERTVQALLDIRRRGFDLVIVEVSPLEFVGDVKDPLADLALRLWRLQREAIRFRYEQAGVAVVQWDGKAPLAALVEGARTFRRSMHHVFV